MDQIKISVIVPIYNVETFLPKCVESIILQSHKNVEIILINDGSPDSCGQICDEYANKDARIKVIHKNNSGVSDTRNIGIENATGDYVCFVDGDDYIMDDYVSYLLKLAIEENAQVALTTDMFGNFELNQVETETKKTLTNIEAVESILCYHIPIGCYCKIFKRDFLANDIRFFTDLSIGEGFNFNIFAFKQANKVVVGNRKIYYYRRDNPTSAMTTFSSKKCENGLFALEKIKANLSFNNQEIKNAFNYAFWRTNSDFYDMIVLAKAEKDNLELYKKCLKVTKKDAFIALKVPVKKQDKLRAIIMKFCPRMIPWLMIKRRRKYNAEV